MYRIPSTFTVVDPIIVSTMLSDSLNGASQNEREPNP